MSDSIHVDVCPECGMPAHGHGLDPPPHHQCRVDDEMFVPQLYVPAFPLKEVEALLWCVDPVNWRGTPDHRFAWREMRELAAAVRSRLEDMRDELDADRPCACSGADYHLPACGGTCGPG